MIKRIIFSLIYAADSFVSSLVILIIGSLITGGLISASAGFLSPYFAESIPRFIADIGWLDAAIVYFCTRLLVNGVSVRIT